MQLPEMSDTAVSNVVRIADGARKTRVLYAGDMDFAKAQFASVAPQLQLIPTSAVLADGPDSAQAGSDAPSVDVALIDCGAPGVDAPALVETIRARGLDVPLVLALDPGTPDESPTKLATELRVDDYTVKLPGWLGRLTSRLELAIAHHRRRRSLDTMQASVERLRTVVESAPVSLARISRDGTILAMNGAAMEMVSAEGPDAVLGKSLLSFVEAEGADEMRQFIDTVSAGQPGSLEFQAAGATGASRIVDTRAVPLSTDTRGRASALLVLRDVTERKRLEASMFANVAASATAATIGAAAKADTAERENLKQQLEASLAECRRIAAERDVVCGERDVMRGQVEEARAHVSAAEEARAALATATQQLAAATQQLSGLQADYQQVITERDTLVSDLDEVRRQRDAVQGDQGAGREQYEQRLASAEMERARVAARCDALAALLEQTEARHSAAVEDERARAASLDARLREADETRASLAAERDELRRALESAHAERGQLQAALDDVRTGRDAQAADVDAVRHALTQRTNELTARVEAVIAERDALHQELRAAVDTAQPRSEQLQAAFDDMRGSRDATQVHAGHLQAALEDMRASRDATQVHAGHLQAALDDLRAGSDAQVADVVAVRQALTQRVEELQARVEAAMAERDALHDELRAALGAAHARSEQLEAEIERARAGSVTQAVEGESARSTLAQQVERLQAQLDAALADRTGLELALESAREDEAAYLRKAAAEREALRRRLEQRDMEYAQLRAHHAELQAARDSERAKAQAEVSAPPVARVLDPAAGAGDFRDAQLAFREAVQLLSGELHTAIEGTRVQRAAMLRGDDAVESRLHEAETECRRLAAERDERNTTIRALEAEIEQLIEIRREQRKELVRALQESDETERVANTRLAECERLRQMLHEAQAALQRLSKWAATQSTRLSASSGARLMPESESPAPKTRRDDGTTTPPMEASWS